jgi:hypothetical protein
VPEDRRAEPLIRVVQGARRGLVQPRRAGVAHGVTSRSRAATASPPASSGGVGLPLVLVADVPLPGKANRFDYQDIDVAHGQLVIAHMNDAAVVSST